MKLQRSVLLAAVVLVFIPAFAHAQDYASPSVMRIEQGIPQSNLSINFQNYSYTDRSFGNVTVNVNVSSYATGEKARHEIILSTINPTGKYITIAVKPLYCKIGTGDCKPLECDSSSSYADFGPYESKKKTCVITSDTCAGREIRIEYTMLGVSGSATTKKTVKCPQSFCDQVTMSISAPSIVYVGDKILAEGYLSEIGKEGVPSAISVLAGDYSVNTSSNEFGYWHAPVEANKPGYYELFAKSESCNRAVKSSIQILQRKVEIANTSIFVYPKSIDVELGGNALLAVQQNSDENVLVSLTGVPQSWIEPSSFVISRGIRFVYLSPKSAGSYTVNVRSGSEEKNVSLFVAKKEQIETNKQNNAAAMLILIIALIFLLNSKKPSREVSDRKEYLDIVKKEIENSSRVF